MKMERYTDDLYQAACDFLIELNRDGTKHLNWNWARWEWMCFHPYCDRSLLPTAGLWKDGGKVVGAALFDLYHGEAFCSALPEFSELLPDIYNYAWDSLRDENGLGIAVANSDIRTRTTLLSLGYQKAEQNEWIYYVELKEPLPYLLADGFTIREIHFPDDLLAYQKVIYKGFDHEDDQAEWDRMMAYDGPLHPNRDPQLTLAVVDKSGEFAAHCTCWFDLRTDYAYIEPVCTIPAHRGKGLGRAVVCEAVNRCRSMGAKRAIVLSDQEFYKKLGFTELEHYTFYWKNEIKIKINSI